MSTYADRIYEHYAEVRPNCPVPAHADELLRNRRPAFERLIAPLLPASKDAAILDLGSGYGEFLVFSRNEATGKRRELTSMRGKWKPREAWESRTSFAEGRPSFAQGGRTV